MDLQTDIDQRLSPGTAKATVQWQQCNGNSAMATAVQWQQQCNGNSSATAMQWQQQCNGNSSATAMQWQQCNGNSSATAMQWQQQCNGNSNAMATTVQWQQQCTQVRSPWRWNRAHTTQTVDPAADSIHHSGRLVQNDVNQNSAAVVTS